MEDKNGNCISLVLFPCILFFFLAGVLLISTIMVSNPYQKEIIFVVCILSLCWLGLWLWHKNRMRKSKDYGFFLQGNIKLSIVYIFIISFFVVGIIWGKGYQSLQPIFNIDNGIQHIDTLFHSAIAESFSRNGEPVMLINEEHSLHYHVVGHFFMYIISQLTGMPAFLVYNYLYPVIFIPLYLAGILYAVSCGKRAFSMKNHITIVDLTLVSFFITGIAPARWLGKCGIWKSNFLISESYLISQTLELFFFGFLLSIIAMGRRKIKNIILLLLFIPAVVFVIAGAKISVGMTAFSCVVYYLWRNYGKRLWCWAIIAYYGGVFLLCMRIFNDRSDGTTAHIVPFAFYEHCSGPVGYLMHYVVLSGMIMLSGWFLYKEKGKSWKDLIKSKDSLWLELLIFVAVLCYLPGMLFDIAGGSAAYFSYCIEIPALIVLCGFGYLDRIVSCFNKKLKFVVLWMLIIVMVSTPAFPLRKLNLNDVREGSIYAEAMELRNKVNGHPEKYTIFIADTANIMELYRKKEHSIPFVYPGLTGIGVINASYCRDGEYYRISGAKAVGYGFSDVNNDRLTLEQAKVKARAMGKEYMIVVSDSGYEYISL